MKNLLKITLVLLFTFALFSCSNDDDTPQPEKKIDINGVIKDTKVHNKSLDYIYQKIVDSKEKEGEIDTTKVNKKFIIEKTKEYLLSTNELNVSTDMKEKVMKKLSLRFQGNKEYKRKQKLEILYKKLTPTQKNYFMQIINMEASNVKDFQNKILALMERINNDSKMTEKQKYSILIGAGIAYHSYEYWNSNFEKWNTLLSKNNSSMRYNFMAEGGWNNVNWEEVGVDDAMEAVDGAETFSEGGPYGMIAGGIGGAILGSGVSIYNGYYPSTY